MVSIYHSLHAARRPFAYKGATIMAFPVIPLLLPLFRFAIRFILTSGSITYTSKATMTSVEHEPWNLAFSSSSSYLYIGIKLMIWWWDVVAFILTAGLENPNLHQCSSPIKQTKQRPVQFFAKLEKSSWQSVEGQTRSFRQLCSCGFYHNLLVAGSAKNLDDKRIPRKAFSSARNWIS